MAAYQDTPAGWAARWAAEFKKAREPIEKWHTSAEMCTDRYLDEGKREEGIERLNLFSANVNTQESMLYGQTPKVDVSRRFNDADDDIARVGGELMQRNLNGDIEREDDGFRPALGASLNDYMIAGFLGGQRFRYVPTHEDVPEVPEIQARPDGTGGAPGIPAGQKLVDEDVETDYYHWKDQLWSDCRIFSQCRWWAFRSLMSQESIDKKFGTKVTIPLAVKEGGGADQDPATPWDRAEIWEIWDKEHECVWFYAETASEVLQQEGVQHEANGSLADPLGISGFWPFPTPRLTNATTRKFVPRPDFSLAQDLYNAIDDETTRIANLRDAIKVSGVYDKTVGELASILVGKSNKMVPAQNYAQLAEGGGIAGAIAWLPLDAIVAALDKLRELRQEDMALLYQVSGMSDIMRGQATAAGATATEQAIKAKFAGVRMQKAQDVIAGYASDGQRIRGEIIAKHFSPETILRRANAQGLPQVDQQFIQPAIAMLKSDYSTYRIAVKPESISLTDYAANKQESMDVLGTIASYVQSIAPLVQQSPQAAPALLQLLQAFIARVKGGDAVEGIMDQAIRVAEQAAAAAQNAPPQPNPQLEVAKVKAQAETGKAKADMIGTALDMQVKQASHQMDMQKLEAEQRKEGIATLAKLAIPGSPAQAPA